MTNAVAIIAKENMTVSMCLCVCLILAIYLLIHFSYIYYKAKCVYNYEGTYYKPSELKKLIKSSFNVIKNNVNTINHPYFYSQSVHQILNIVPSFINVFALCKYIQTYSQARIDFIYILKEFYGDHYEKSPELNVISRIKTSEYGVDEYFHYILEDIEKALKLYVDNKEYVNKLFI